jgi:hypothetical protein
MSFEYELMSITTYDNITYQLTDGVSRFVVATPPDWGLPPIEYLLQRSYKQDGATETGYRLNTRPFTVGFRNNGCSRDQYWSIRESLINITRPNRLGQMIFTIRLSTGELRSIVVRSTSPVFPEVEVTKWDEFSITEILQFEAFDPIWFEPTEVTYAVSNIPADELTFPALFDDDDIIFGGDSYGIASISYLGNWYAYPVIRIGAPFTQVVMSHIDTGAVVGLTTGVSSGYIDFDFQNLTITDNNGNDLWGYLTPDSDVQQFRLEPDPIVANGLNQINFFLPGFTGSTTISVFYNLRYIGI